MQNLNLNISAFIDKINDYAIFIISFLKTTFNNIIAIRNVSFSFFYIPNSIGIILSFLLSIFYILIFITLLCFLGSIFNIIKTIIKYIIYCPIKYFLLGIYYFFYLIFKLFIKSQPPVEPIVQPVKSNNDLINLQRKISNLEYKLNLQKKQNIIKPVYNQNYKKKD
uniref:Putative secretory protein n=1 Tax=Primula red phytoplasma TaxID=1532528 RepID=A0A096XTL2_9MOLU|nr:hypothetical protein [Primula red phytoplasma]AIJ02301.1 putative secretory protein [Primula red phytoplasma]